MTISIEDIRSMYSSRYTCKRYDPTGSVSDEDFQIILEAARKSPSSFGLEPWKFVVLGHEDILHEIEEVVWGMKRHAARNVIILAKRNVDAHSDYVRWRKQEQLGLSEADFNQFKEVFLAYQTSNLPIADNPALQFEWACRQTYIALANMLTTAAFLGIDSTPVEGFDVQAVNDILTHHNVIDPLEWSVSVMVQFGVADPTHFTPIQHRLSESEVIVHA